MKEINTTTANKWWDTLSHEQKDWFIHHMNSFNCGRPVKVYCISKDQKKELYYQVHEIFGRSLRQHPVNGFTFANYGY